MHLPIVLCIILLFASHYVSTYQVGESVPVVSLIASCFQSVLAITLTDVVGCPISPCLVWSRPLLDAMEVTITTDMVFSHRPLAGENHAGVQSLFLLDLRQQVAEARHPALFTLFHRCYYNVKFEQKYFYHRKCQHISDKHELTDLENAFVTGFSLQDKQVDKWEKDKKNLKNNRCQAKKRYKKEKLNAHPKLSGEGHQVPWHLQAPKLMPRL